VIGSAVRARTCRTFHVAGDIAATGVVVAGSVKGTLVADERIHLKPGAQVDGDLTAPKIAFEDGATARGKVNAAGQDRVTLVA
jgi:cytoskeletal protein CcmA (bactofilin family)